MAATTLATVVTACTGLPVGHTGGAIVRGPAGTAATATGDAAGGRERDDDCPGRERFASVVPRLLPTGSRELGSARDGVEPRAP
jgi:hypothetical protein